MPSEGFTEKTLLYSLCDFLLRRRINTKGTNTPVSTSVSELITTLGTYTDESDDRAVWSIIASELENLLLYEENEKGGRLIRFADEQMNTEKMKVAESTETLIFIYNRADIERYINNLKDGDSKKTGKLVWVQSKGIFKYGEKEMKVVKSSGRSFSYYTCALLFGEKISLEESDSTVSIDENIEKGYEAGGFVSVNDLETLIRQINYMDSEIPVEESRTLRDAISGVNERAIEKFGFKIFQIEGESVKVVI